MSTFSRGGKIGASMFVEIEVGDNLWRITQRKDSAVTFELRENDDWLEIQNPPSSVRQLWYLINTDAIGEGNN